jgi:sarcosine oxidase subunit alpha
MGNRNWIIHLKSIKRGKEITVVINGQLSTACEGETVATALLAGSQIITRISAVKKEARGIFCGIGNCFECRVVIDDVTNVRSCITYVEEGMRIETSGMVVP